MAKLIVPLRQRIFSALGLYRIRSAWRAHQRQVDVDILWPACLEKAPTVGQARVAFLMHALRDPAWAGEMPDEIVMEEVEMLPIPVTVDSIARRLSR